MNSKPIDSTDSRLLEALQAGLEVAERPFAPLARTLALDEQELLKRLESLTRRGLLKRIGPMLDLQACGYRSVLAAARVPDSEAARVGRTISAFPGVSHNYLRKVVRPRGQSAYNVWFTLSAASQTALTAALRRIARAIGYPVAPMPVRRAFKLAVQFDLNHDSPTH